MNANRKQSVKRPNFQNGYFGVRADPIAVLF